ncbi:MAG: hypothetical protein V1888_03715 [archaeon]
MEKNNKINCEEPWDIPEQSSEVKADDCILCGKDLEKYEFEFCDSCRKFMLAKYSRTKYWEVKKWHKENRRSLE